MKEFRTIFPAFKGAVSLTHQDNIVCMGSCFAEHIGSRLESLKFRVLLNPAGIIYNPVSVVNTLERILSGIPFDESEIIQDQGLWHSFEHHGRFSHPDKIFMLRQMNEALLKAHSFLKTTNRLIITLGTANVFVNKKTGKAVANCHKVRAVEFIRRRLTISEATDSLLFTLAKLKQHLPELQIIVTVSPVRHLRDGLVENQRSKATLLLSLEEVASALNYVFYFPSYEILLDDLRDYRFYEENLSHPNQFAIDYIWEYFENAFMSDKTKALNKLLNQLWEAISHRPFHSDSPAHQAFVRKTLERLAEIKIRYPYLQLDAEQKILESVLL
jgi:hypothetical protein